MSTQNTLISEDELARAQGYFNALHTAAVEEHLCLASSTVKGTGERAAILCGFLMEDDTVKLTPLAMLCRSDLAIDEAGYLTKYGREAYDAVVDMLQALGTPAAVPCTFGRDEDGRVCLGVRLPHHDTPRALLIMPWSDDPFDLFEDPTTH